MRGLPLNRYTLNINDRQLLMASNKSLLSSIQVNCVYSDTDKGIIRVSHDYQQSHLHNIRHNNIRVTSFEQNASENYALLSQRTGNRIAHLQQNVAEMGAHLELQQNKAQQQDDEPQQLRMRLQQPDRQKMQGCQHNADREAELKVQSARLSTSEFIQWV